MGQYKQALYQPATRSRWIIVLLATGAGLALAVGVLGLFAALPAADADQPRAVYRVVATIPLPTGIGDNPRDVAVNPTTGYVYVANESMGTLSVLSDTQLMATIPLTHHPYALAVNPATGYVYVTHTRGPRPNSFGLTVVRDTDVVAVLPDGAVDSEVVVNQGTGYVYLNAGGGRVAVISGTEVIGGIPFRSGARAFAVNPRTGYVYAIDSANHSVAVISGTEQITNIPVGDTPLDLDLDPTSGLVYVANASSDSVSILRDTQVITTMTVGGKPHDITVNATTGYVYVLNGASRDVSVLYGTDLVGTILSDLDGRTVSKLGSGPAEYSYALISPGSWETRYAAAVISGTMVIDTVEVGDGPEGFGFNPVTGYVYITGYYDGTVSVIEGTERIATIPHRAVPEDVIVDPVTGFTYVANGNGSQTVSVISGTQSITDLVVGESPMALAVDEESGHVYVANEDSDSVTVLQGIHVIATLPVQNRPVAVAVDPNTGYAYVAHLGSRDMAVISGTRVITSVVLPAPAIGVYVNPASGYIYADLYNYPALAIVRGTEVVATVDVPDYYFRIVGSNPDTGYVYVTAPGISTILLIKGTMVVDEFLWHRSIFGLGVNRTTDYLYVAGEWSIGVISGTEVLTDVTMPGVWRIVVGDPSTATTYVAGGWGGIGILEGITHVTTVAVGHRPTAIAVAPDTGDAYVANWGSGDVSVIRKIRLPHQAYLPLTLKSFPPSPTPTSTPTWTPELISNFRMSDRPDGPAMTDFPDDIGAVYVIFDYEDAQDEEIRVKVYWPWGDLLLDEVRTYNGNGTEVFEILAPAGGFAHTNPGNPEDTYLSAIYVRIGTWVPAASIEWTVSAAPTPTYTATATETATPTATATPSHPYAIFLPAVLNRYPMPSVLR